MQILKYAHAATQSSNLSVIIPSRHVTASRWYNHQGSPKTRASTSASSRLRLCTASSAASAASSSLLIAIPHAVRTVYITVYQAYSLPRCPAKHPSTCSFTPHQRTEPAHREPPHSAWLPPRRMHEIPPLLCSIRPAASEITGLMR